MEETDAQSRGGGRVRKKSQKLLEMEDFASAWKEQSTGGKSSHGVSARSPKKKVPTKTLDSEGKATSTDLVPILSSPPLPPASRQEKLFTVSVAENERQRKTERDEDWRSDDANIDGTPANPKLPTKSSFLNSSNDQRTITSKSLVITKTNSVHFAPNGVERFGAKGEIVGLKVGKVEVGSKRPKEADSNRDATPKKILKSTNGTPFKTALPLGKTSTSNLPATPSRAPPPPTPPSVAKSKQNNFEEELLKADLALMKQKQAKKIKIASVSAPEKTTPAAAAAPVAPKIEVLPTIILSTSHSSLSSASPASEIEDDSNSPREKNFASEKLEKTADLERSKEKKAKKKTREPEHSKSEISNVAQENTVDKAPSDSSSRRNVDPDAEGYLLFCKTARRKVKKDFPSISFSDITRVAVERWNALSPREKLIWSKKALKHLADDNSRVTDGNKSSATSGASKKMKFVGKHSSSSSSSAKLVSSVAARKQHRGLNVKHLKSIQKLQRAQIVKEQQKRTEQRQEVELKPELDERPQLSSVPTHKPSQSLVAPPSSPPPPPPPPTPKLDPTTFIPPSDLDYSALSQPSLDGSSSSSFSATASAHSSPSTLDSAANLKLLGESLTVIGTRLAATTTPLAVQGGLSVLMDSLLCATAPLSALLSSAVPEIHDEETTRMQAQILENAAYIMPGM